MPDFGRYDADRQEYAEERRLLAIRAKRAGRTPRAQEYHEARVNVERQKALRAEWAAERRARQAVNGPPVWFDRQSKRPTNRGNR